MNTVIDTIPNGTNPLPVIATEELPLDILNRQEVVEQLMQLLNIISDNRSSSTFALNGTWGVGKTFVLNRLMKQLLEYQDGEKFFVFHYNCWQYDYYEEPLIAIVAAMLDSVDQENHFFSQNLREKAKQGMAVAKPILVNIAKDFIKKKVGVDITDLITFFKDGAEAVEEVNDKINDANDYDKYYSFKKAISSAQAGIRTLSKDRTVVVIVDELDRCLPSYAIKVMERLHHLFAGLDNCAVILAVDKGQLNQTVQQIFGVDTDTTKYLKKFINFEVELDNGKIAGGFAEKYAEYFNLFDNSLICTELSLDRFFSALLAETDARTQERIMERIWTVHRILFPEETKDYSFMCAEVMWVVLAEQNDCKTKMPISYDSSYRNRGFCLHDNVLPEFTEYMKSEWRNIQMREAHNFANEKPITVFTSTIDMPELLIWYFWQLYPNASRTYQIDGKHPKFTEFQQNVKDLQKYVALLRIIK